MKFLVQKINREIRHDFSFALTESVRFHNWLKNGTKMSIKFFNTRTDDEGDILPFDFKLNFPYKRYVPVGSVEFVLQYLGYYYGRETKPLNVPEELFYYAGRRIFNGTEKDLKGKLFVKSNDRIKSTCGIINEGEIELPIGNYQFSEVVNIDSEWRAFVYKGKLVGLQNYVGEFTRWPNMGVVRGMIGMYRSAPIAYTLDIGISDERGTFVIECHDFFSCGLYGFADYSKLPFMFHNWFNEYLRNGK